MSLVIKSWKVTPNAAVGQAWVDINARKSGLISWLLSLLGIDATVTLQVTPRHAFFGTGSLAGFDRRLVPLGQISTMFYGLYKPWKTTILFIMISLVLGLRLIAAGGTTAIIIGTLVLFGGIGAAIFYYFFKRSITVGFMVGMRTYALNFKRSVIEGEPIDEQASESVIQILGHLIKPMPGMTLAAIGVGASGGALPLADASSSCPKCGAPTSTSDTFCGSCGHKLS